MNKIYIFFGLVLLVSCAPSDIPPEKLEERQGVYYEVNSQIPYSGPIERYYENRQWKVMGNYKDGKREGLWEEYHDNGKLKETGNYKDGKQEGLWEYYQDNGVLDRRVYYKDEKNVWVSNPQSPEDIVTRDGITYQINKSNPFYGTVKFYHTGFYGDKLSLYVVHTYIDGRRNGSFESYHKNGQVLGKGNYKDGNKDGPFEFYYDNGQLDKTENWKDGKQDGFWEDYYKSGQLYNTENYKDGKQEGLSIYDRRKFCYKNDEQTDMSYCEK